MYSSSIRNQLDLQYKFATACPDNISYRYVFWLYRVFHSHLRTFSIVNSLFWNTSSWDPWGYILYETRMTGFGSDDSACEDLFGHRYLRAETTRRLEIVRWATINWYCCPWHYPNTLARNLEESMSDKDLSQSRVSGHLLQPMETKEGQNCWIAPILAIYGVRWLIQKQLAIWIIHLRAMNSNKILFHVMGWLTATGHGPVSQLLWKAVQGRWRPFDFSVLY